MRAKASTGAYRPAFLAGAFFAAGFVEPVAFFAADFTAPVAFFAADFTAPVAPVALAPVFLAAGFALPVASLAAGFAAPVPLTGVAVGLAAFVALAALAGAAAFVAFALAGFAAAAGFAALAGFAAAAGFAALVALVAAGFAAAVDLLAAGFAALVAFVAAGFAAFFAGAGTATSSTVRDRISPLAEIMAAEACANGDDTPMYARRVAVLDDGAPCVLVGAGATETVAPQRFRRRRYFLSLARVAPPRPRSVAPDSLSIRCTKP